MNPVTRREVLALATLMAAGCGISAPDVTPSRQGGGTSVGGQVPAAASWQAGAGEVRPQLKELASSLVETAGTWTGGAHTAADLRTRLSGAGFAPALARPTGALLADAPEASLTVTYPQYGGLGDGRASVIVTAEQTLVTAGSVARRGHTLDVRLIEGAAGAWTVEAVLAGVPRPASLPLDASRQAVLEDPRIALPAAAAADVRAGVIDSDVLGMLSGLAGEYEFTVTVLVTGHPRNVFGTDRISKHTLGRAVDIWRIDGYAVADPTTPRHLVTSVMRRAAKLGATEIGGPVDLDARRGGIFFTDEVHHDHLHLGVPGAEDAGA
jgi:hypothetical protein